MIVNKHLFLITNKNNDNVIVVMKLIWLVGGLIQELEPT